MNDLLHSNLAAWANFYLVTASAAAALTGLQFVVQTLIASEAFRRAAGTDPEAGIATFATPTVVHFSLAMVISAICCAPWYGMDALRITLGAIAIGALIYQSIVVRRAVRQKVYEVTAYDWVWYFTFPSIAYVAMLAAVLIGPERAQWAPFVSAACVIILLCVGIHNSWDSVTYMTIMSVRKMKESPDDKPSDHKPHDHKPRDHKPRRGG